MMPGTTGAELLRALREVSPETTGEAPVPKHHCAATSA